MILVDTNILLRIEQKNHPQSAQAFQATENLIKNDCELFVVPQIFAEFWNVATRPSDKNGLGMSCGWTASKIKQLREIFTLQHDQPQNYDQWLDLVSRYEVKGKNVHDARLVAAMLVQDSTYVLTYNVNDFKRFQEITVIQPGDVDEEFALIEKPS
ncbi:hypothetical protein C1752_00994 [Acaryochloris thomasi RCC1774]|uniref:PIN domain-containing protein n=1 Tax=Acaryochloris thomasi RCC1774 TaxID=1764569 RepID=A0A2W1JNN2_9CYAN|nr:PIN domain-containing protein [Acaryochloris thomasi]PZD74836.1 hypothetical protein C1752_00994 [Acaryochloris thomasi RCC1774]